MRELPDDVLLIVDDPHVLLSVVRIHLDLVRTASALVLREHLFHERPFVDELAVTVDDEDRVVPPPLPSALCDRLARRTQPVTVARRVAARHLTREHAVRRPGLRALW